MFFFQGRMHLRLEKARWLVDPPSVSVRCASTDSDLDPAPTLSRTHSKIEIKVLHNHFHPFSLQFMASVRQAAHSGHLHVLRRQHRNFSSIGGGRIPQSNIAESCLTLRMDGAHRNIRCRKYFSIFFHLKLLIKLFFR